MNTYQRLLIESYNDACYAHLQSKNDWTRRVTLDWVARTRALLITNSVSFTEMIQVPGANRTEAARYLVRR